MKKILSILFIGLTLGLVGCDTKGVDFDIETFGHYIDNTECLDIDTYNGYKMIDSDSIKNEDGSYTITIKINKPIK